MIGKTLDRYVVEARLGEGGMGVVYKARDTRLDRTVAIKVLPPDRLLDPERRRRFVQEAKAASALNHPNIVAVYDVSADAGVDFIVMEYADGVTLDRVIQARGLSVAKALRYAVQIADALAAAHAAGIVHRDLKPANVMVTGQDRIKILDFGLAKLLEAPASRDTAETRTSPNTQAGVIVGTAAYMSPEQAEGRTVDGRSDIFSFGAVLYEMVTGRRPFAGDSNISVLARILNDDPAPPTSVVASIPIDVERAILRCLRKDPARRFQTMADLKVALDDLVADSDARPAPAQAPLARGGRFWWISAATIPLAIAAIYMTSLWRHAAPAPAPLRAVPLTTLPGSVRSPSFSPDAGHVAFSWNGRNQDNRDVYVQQIGAGEPLRLTSDPANDYSPVWSPDGRAIAFLRELPDHLSHELRLVPPLGGPERKITDITPRGFLRPVTLAWCPDSSCVVLTDSANPTTGPDALYVVSLDSGEKRQLTDGGRVRRFADSDPAVSPDGRWIVFRRDDAPFSGTLQLLQLDPGMVPKGEPRTITRTLLQAYAPRWASPDEFVFSAKGALWRMSTAVGNIPERLPFIGEDGVMPFVSARRPGGEYRLAYVRSYTDTNIWRIDTSAAGAPATSPPTLAVSSTRRDALAQLSPDGSRVVFLSNRSGESEVWVSDAQGGGAVQLSALGATPGYPRWSPDGKLIAFHSNDAEQVTGDVYVVDAQGGKPRNITRNPAATDTFPSFSHDGQGVYFASSRAAEPRCWKGPVNGGQAVQVIDKQCLMALESTDGAFLYFVESRESEGTGPLWRLPLVGGGAPVKLTDNVRPLDFDVVDGGVYYLEREAGDGRLRFFGFATGRSIVVAANLGNLEAGLSASRDGRQILFSRVDSTANDLMLVDRFR
jgi:Tol biopolymer transport system component/tRNA A-37 threonylcarbamoyl transferase component Bud32